MVVAYLRGVLKRDCNDARDHLAEEMILNGIDAELSAEERVVESLVTAAALDCCEPRKRPEIMGRTERSLLRASQLNRVDLYDSERRLGLRGFGTGQQYSLVKLFRLAKKNGIIRAIHESCQQATQQD